MLADYDLKAPKRSANLSINSDLLGQARAMGINLSSLMEEALAEAVRVRRQAQWLEANRDAMAAYNRQIEQHGTFSDAVRSF